jgi:hypothetical protein
MVVGYVGYESTGSLTPDVIINRLVGPEMKDDLMQIGKSSKFFKPFLAYFLVVLLATLLVGITLRT